jgi:hypothetical protein
MGNGTKIPKLGERVRESKGYNYRYFFRDQTIFVYTSGLSRKKAPLWKKYTEKYRKLKMLNFLEFLDYSYTRAYAYKIIMHYVPTPERRKRRMVSSTSCSITVGEVVM